VRAIHDLGMPGGLTPARGARGQNRRAFLRQLAVLAMGAGIADPRRHGGPPPSKGSHTPDSPDSVPDARRLGHIGIQLYTVRQLMSQDLDATLAGLAHIGYTEVELAGLHGLTAVEMRRRLDRYGLAAVSSHLALRDMRRDWPRALDDAKTLGQRYIVCSSIDESERSAAGYRRIPAELNDLAGVARQHGLQFAYHNHMYEFTPVDGVEFYDLLLTECDPRLVQMEVDLMWMTKAGGDPLQYFQRFPGRFPLVHVKDMSRDGRIVDVGQGIIDFRSIFAQSERGGIKHYFVEHDEPPQPLADAKVCYDYLRRLTF
jgi:sugar phosphate isomerase/epimerase